MSSFQPSLEEWEQYQQTFQIPKPPPEISDYQIERLQLLLREQASRKLEGLSLYEPLPFASIFHQSKAKERILRGGNRSGKTCASAIEIARALTGRDPFDKYPLTEGRCYAVGPNEKHIREVMWPKLGRPGAYYIIRDEVTDLWRPYRPDDPKDAARKKDSRPAPPLIPDRLIKNIVWNKKRANLPDMVTLTNGWEISFFTAGTVPPRGVPLDLVWFDEDFESDLWYAEMAARLVDRGGHFIWSATPEAGSVQLFDLSSRAQDQESLSDDEAITREFVAHIDNNPYIPEKERKTFVQKLMMDMDKYRVKVAGEFFRALNLVYPEFNEMMHTMPRMTHIPSKWTKYAIIDPGYQVCAILFIAVPPPHDPINGRHIYLYDEAYIPLCTAKIFGQKMREKCMGRTFQNFIIDKKGSERTEGNTGKTLRYHYARALEHYRVSSVESGNDFTVSAVDRKGGIEAVRELLRVRDENERPRLQVVKDCCKNFLEEIKRYRYKRDKHGATDEPEQRGRVHTMDCLRYAAQANLRWVKPVAKALQSPALKALKAKRERLGYGDKIAFLGPAGDFARGG